MDRRQLTVDTKGGADFLSIADAIRAAAPGDAVILRMGLFEEKVHVTKEIELIADGAAERGEVIINSGIIISANATIRNVFIQQQVDVRKGVAVLLGCDLSLGADGIRICSDAKATLTECSIHDVSTGGDGVYVQEGGNVEITKCDIFNCRVNGVHVKGGEATVKETRIRDCDFGVYFRKGGKGSVEGCTFERIHSFGVYVTGGSDPLILHNTLRLCDVHGVMVSQQGGGNYRDNTVEGSVRILKGCTPTLNINHITGRVDNELVSAVPPAVAA